MFHKVSVEKLYIFTNRCFFAKKNIVAGYIEKIQYKRTTMNMYYGFIGSICRFFYFMLIV